MARHGVVDQNNPNLATQNLTFTKVVCGFGDPRYGFFTVYYWQTEPGMQYRPLTNFPIPHFARELGGRFAVEPEPEPKPKPKPKLGSMCRHVRTRWTQTKPAKVSTSDANVPKRCKRAEYLTRIDNFGLPPGMCLSAVICIMRQRGTSIGSSCLNKKIFSAPSVDLRRPKDQMFGRWSVWPQL